MFESARSGSAGGGPSEQARLAAITRLRKVMPPRPLRPTGLVAGPFQRAVKIAPGVYQAPGRRMMRPDEAVSAPPAVLPGAGPDTAESGGDWVGPPGPAMARVLDVAVPGELSSYELIEAVAGWERVGSWVAARQAQVIAEFARRRPGPYAPDEPGPTVSEFAADEIAARLAITHRAADLKLGLALDLADRLPGTLAALAAGDIDVPKARAVADHTRVLDAAGCAAVEARVLPRAGTQTTSGLRRSLARAVVRVDPQAASKRRQTAAAGRWVRLHPQPDGMAELSAMLPAEDAVTAFNSIDRFARDTDPDDPRSLEARRADALVDLCTGGATTVGATGDGGTDGTVAGEDDMVAAGHDAAVSEAAEDKNSTRPGGDRRGRRGRSRHRDRRRRRDRRDLRARRDRRRRRRGAGRGGRDGPLVQVTMAASTLLGLDEAPAELAGYGPIPAEVAREIAADPDGTWRRILTDPASGELLDYGTAVYRPPASLVRHVIARDRVCQFPGCRQPAHRCDLDHGVPYPHGQTCPGNLIPLCRHHHRAKTEGGWQWTRLPDGRVVWTAPTGHTYPADPNAVLEAWADDEPDTALGADSPAATGTAGKGPDGPAAVEAAEVTDPNSVPDADDCPF